MTFEEVCEAAKRNCGPWRLHYGFVRGYRSSDTALVCPIAAAVNSLSSCCNVDAVYGEYDQELGLSEDTRIELVAAADQEDAPKRAIMLKILGISP